ncbi:MAG: hypothetical protein K9I94_12515 [Bacteroidales bacterium]|nr:hypothetical protein [Bacteroidales bacterium]
MSKKEKSTPKSDSAKGQTRKGHRIGEDKLNINAWQPTVDKTTTPPKKDVSKDKK